MGGRRGDYNERAWSRSQKEQYESGYRQQASSTSGTEVRHGRITETGDIEFSEIRGVEEDSLNLDRESASGDDVSESLASSRGTEVLNDPDCENNGYIEVLMYYILSSEVARTYEIFYCVTHPIMIL